MGGVGGQLARNPPAVKTLNTGPHPSKTLLPRNPTGTLHAHSYKGLPTDGYQHLSWGTSHPSPAGDADGIIGTGSNVRIRQPEAFMDKLSNCKSPWTSLPQACEAHKSRCVIGTASNVRCSIRNRGQVKVLIIIICTNREQRYASC